MTTNKVRPAAQQKVVVSAKVDPDVFAAIQRDAADNFTNTSDVVNTRLGAVYRAAEPEAFPVTAATVARDRKSEIENELLELKLARERGELISRNKAFELVARDYATIKSRLNNIPQALIGATPEQVDDLKKIVQDCMTDLSAEKREAWDDID